MRRFDRPTSSRPAIGTYLNGALVGDGIVRYNSAEGFVSVLRNFRESSAMDHELREKCLDLITRIKHLQDSL